MKYKLIFWLILGPIPKILHQVWVNFQKSEKKNLKPEVLTVRIIWSMQSLPRVRVRSEGGTPENYW